MFYFSRCVGRNTVTSAVNSAYMRGSTWWHALCLGAVGVRTILALEVVWLLVKTRIIKPEKILFLTLHSIR